MIIWKLQALLTHEHDQIEIAWRMPQRREQQRQFAAVLRAAVDDRSLTVEQARALLSEAP